MIVELEQQVSFCRAEDGVRIAYATAGAGYPVVYVTGWPVHLELEWQKPFIRRFLCALASEFTLIRYDMRGSGLSDRSVTDFSLPALLLDLRAVVAHLRVRSFALLALGDVAGPLAMMFAAERRDAVTHLMLNSAYVQGAAVATPDRQDATINFVRNFGFPIFEFTDAQTLTADQQRALREIQEASASHEVQGAILRTMYDANVEDVLPHLRMPVLIMHARDDPLVPFACGQDLADRLPHATFLPFEGASGSVIAHQAVLTSAVRRFLGVTPSADDVAPGGDASARRSLTPREIEILQRLTMGETNREIADALVLSHRTVERHIDNIYGKICVSTRAQATAYALTHGLVLPR